MQQPINTATSAELKALYALLDKVLKKANLDKLCEINQQDHSIRFRTAATNPQQMQIIQALAPLQNEHRVFELKDGFTEKVVGVPITTVRLGRGRVVVMKPEKRQLQCLKIKFFDPEKVKELSQLKNKPADDIWNLIPENIQDKWEEFSEELQKYIVECATKGEAIFTTGLDSQLLNETCMDPIGARAFRFPVKIQGAAPAGTTEAERVHELVAILQYKKVEEKGMGAYRNPFTNQFFSLAQVTPDPKMLDLLKERADKLRAEALLASSAKVEESAGSAGPAGSPVFIAQTSSPGGAALETKVQKAAEPAVDTAAGVKSKSKIPEEGEEASYNLNLKVIPAAGAGSVAETKPVSAASGSGSSTARPVAVVAAQVPQVIAGTAPLQRFFPAQGGGVPRQTLEDQLPLEKFLNNLNKF